MNDRAVAVFEQYDFEIEQTKKARGAIVAITDIGPVALWEYTGKTEKLQNYKAVCDKLCELGFPYADNLIENTQGQLYVTDYDGKRYIVKKHFDGRECDVYNVEDCRFIVGELAKLHKLMEFGEDFTSETAIVRDFSKRETELLRVRSFMRRVSQKGEFEMCFLKEYPYFEEVAKEATAVLNPECLMRLTELVQKRGMFCHGDCNQHNILIQEGNMVATHFEKCCKDIQVRDLYLFLRKILEKNKWSYDFGMQVLDAYLSEKELDKDEKRYLFARLLYPERFWKIANAYLNKRKSLPPRRQSEKLQALKEIELARREFLNKLEKELL